MTPIDLTQPRDLAVAVAAITFAGIVGALITDTWHREREHTREVARHRRTRQRVAVLERRVARLEGALMEALQTARDNPYPPPLNRAQRAAISAQHQLVTPLRPVPQPLRRRIEAGDPALRTGPVMFARPAGAGR